MKKEIQEVMADWCWLVSSRGTFKVSTFHCDELITEISVEEYLRINYPTDAVSRRRPFQTAPDGTEYLAASAYFEPEYAQKRAAKRQARLSRRGLLQEPAFWMEGAIYALSILTSRRNYQVIAADKPSEPKPLKQEIQKLLDDLCWATFTEGRFKLTRFGCDELIAYSGADELFRTLPDSSFMGRPAAIPEGVHFLVRCPRFSPAEPLNERAAEPLGRGNKPDRPVRWIRWALGRLSSTSLRRARSEIHSYNTTHAR